MAPLVACTAAGRASATPNLSTNNGEQDYTIKHHATPHPAVSTLGRSHGIPALAAKPHDLQLRNPVNNKENGNEVLVVALLCGTCGTQALDDNDARQGTAVTIKGCRQCQRPVCSVCRILRLPKVLLWLQGLRRHAARSPRSGSTGPDHEKPTRRHEEVAAVRLWQSVGHGPAQGQAAVHPSDLARGCTSRGLGYNQEVPAIPYRGDDLLDRVVLPPRLCVDEPVDPCRWHWFEDCASAL